MVGDAMGAILWVDAAFAALIGAADATAIEEDDEPISDDSDAEA